MTFIVNGVEVDAHGKVLKQDGAPVNPLQEQLDEARTVGNKLGHALQQVGQILPLQAGTDLTDGSVLRSVQDLQLKVRDQAKIIETGTADNQRLIAAAGASNDNSFRLKGELDKVQASHAAAKVEWGKERDSLLIDTADALKREDALKAELESAQSDFIQYQNDLPSLKARVAELEAGESGDGPQPGDTDTRTRAQLKAALDAKGIGYDAAANRPALLALAAEHSA